MVLAKPRPGLCSAFTAGGAGGWVGPCFFGVGHPLSLEHRFSALFSFFAPAVETRAFVRTHYIPFRHSFEACGAGSGHLHRFLDNIVPLFGSCGPLFSYHPGQALRKMPLNPDTLARGQNISKKYYAYNPAGRRAAVSDIIRETFFFKKNPAQAQHTYTWALKNASFEIMRGERILLTGPNRSGKTPILNLLCGLTKPDEGTLDVKGRAVLLSSNATLFHRSHSLIENVLTMASLFGIPRNLAKDQLDSILTASGPLPADCSTIGLLSHHGIWMRLAVSILLHAEADLYLIDEALLENSGPFLEFVEKKFEEFRSKKRSVVAISHEPEKLKNYFDRIWRIEKGVLRDITS